MSGFRRWIASFALISSLFLTVGASAQENMGRPTEKGIWLQPAANEQASRIADFHEVLLIIITVVTVFVFLLMFYTMFRFRAKANPVPSKVSHNSVLEVVWTALPVLILVAIGTISIPLLYYQEEIPETEFAIQVSGNQWNWTYIYPDHDGIEFTASLVPDTAFRNAEERTKYEADLTEFLGKPSQLNARLLDTDYRLVVPEDTKVKLLLAASDVIHAWTVPAFGVKMDAVPGRVNETWFEVSEPGTYYGQCSELCGKDHAFMPIAVEVLSKEDFAAWVDRSKALYATTAPSTMVASVTKAIEAQSKPVDMINPSAVTSGYGR